MPWYRYWCAMCRREYDVWRTVEERNVQPSCRGVSSVRTYPMPFIAAEARPTSAGSTADRLARGRAEAKDMAAYARLRKDGTQPPQINGSARLEQQAETSTEIEMGKVLGDAKKVAEGVERSKELGYL